LALHIKGGTQNEGIENKVLRKVFGPKRDEVRGEWRRLHSEELNNLYSSPNITRMIIPRIMRWAGYVACMRDRRGAYTVLVGRPDGRRPYGKSRRRWENINETNLQEMGWGVMDWTGLIWPRIWTCGGLL
jgi:hypothetical protein